MDGRSATLCENSTPMTGDHEPAEQALERLCKRHFGNQSRLDNIVLPTLGGSNRTIIFDLIEGSARRRLVSRQETYIDPLSPFLPPEHQFRIMSIAFAHGLTVPEPIILFEPQDELGRGFITAFVAGETMPKRILSAPEWAGARLRLVDQCAQQLARLHAIAASEMGFLADIEDSRDPINAERIRLDSYGEAHPAIELGLRWMERNRPPARPPMPVHGDFRTGNFIVNGDGLAAILDWECTHLGSPIRDLGWLCTRSWRFSRPDLPVGGFSERTAFYRAYEAASGIKIDPEEVRFWEIFGLTRWAVLNVMQAHGHMTGRRKGVVFAACGRNTALCEYDLLMTLKGEYT